MNSLKTKYGEYYNAKGSYRKYLMKQQSANTAEIYDYFSKLEVRCKQISRCQELSQASAPFISSMLVRIGEFVIDLRNLTSHVFEQEGEKLHKVFADSYDVAASIVEGFELKVSKYLNNLPQAKLSEDAKFIQRRTHFQKNTGKFNQRSTATKLAWKTHQNKFRTGIKKFHKSSAGKQFHRNLARFNKRRSGISEDFEFSQDDVIMTCKGLSSMLTHVLIEIQNLFTDNAEKITEQVLEEASSLKEFFHIFNEALSCLVDAYFEDDKDAVADIVDMVRDFYDIYGAGDKQIADTPADVVAWP